MENFLTKKFGKIFNLQFIAEGWWSKAYSFTAEGQQYIIRTGNHVQDFMKDHWAFIHLNNTKIPIPEVLEYGNYHDNVYYCISRKANGDPSDEIMDHLDHYSQTELAKIIIRQLENIHLSDTTNLSGWGFTDAQGKGMFPSWQHFLLSFYNSKTTASWQHLAQTSWLNRQLFTHLIEKMKSFFPYLPNEKYILHGDFGFDNLLLDGNRKVTAVLDWAEMMLGDPLYDLLHMNEPWIRDTGPDFLSIWLNMKPGYINFEHIEERLQCYHIHYTLFHLYIHTVRKEHDDYQKIENWAINNL
ncbi:aminoglycoside phosphotransferase family protein [Chryseobacterium sp. Chry.R1]|uniref:aminoglycoside phosphotransferase family protein n=1 Tax=Chryseobacterium sp. Chry.R1 TaxID=3139392 RepID=UPI0031F7F2B0